MGSDTTSLLRRGLVGVYLTPLRQRYHRGLQTAWRAAFPAEVSDVAGWDVNDGRTVATGSALKIRA
jgi:hypothetical protein